MADIAMCTNKECEKHSKCYRFLARPSEFRQSYLGNPEKDCVQNDYELFWEQLGRREITDK